MSQLSAGQCTMPLRAAEIKAHPAYNHLDWRLPASFAGYCQVANGRRGGPFRSYYEVHGTGSIHLLFIMGYGTPGSAAKRQLRHFAHRKASAYSCLVFDNRGIGRSDKPLCRYTTAELATDAMDLLEHVDWLARSTSDPLTSRIHIVGSSMGGMIAQELCLLLPPDSIATLTLASTFPRLIRSKGFIETLMQQVNLLFPRGDIDQQLEEFCSGLFTKSYLDEPDTEADDLLTGVKHGGNFPTVGDRICAVELRQREDNQGFGLKGHFLQMAAAATHYKSRKQLQAIRERIGPNRIAVCHGKADKAIEFHHAEVLVGELGEDVELKVWEDAGHVLFWEKEGEFNRWLEDRFLAAVSLAT